MRKSGVRPAMLALLIMLTAVLAVPAYAAGGNTITIHPNGQTGLGGPSRFKAYQIFKGEIGTKAEQLDNLEWGSGVQLCADGQHVEGTCTEENCLIGALKASTLPAGDSTFGEKFTAAYTQWQSTYEKELSEAEFVAQFLAESEHINDPEYADDFARLVAEHISGEGTASVFSGEDWTITAADPGYYLVVDEYASAEGNEESDGSVSSYILEVIGTAEVDLKATIPTVDKKVNSQNAVTAEGGETVTFTLTGTVAANITEYETYSCKFTDTLSKGLTYLDDSLFVTIDGHLLFKSSDQYAVEITKEPEGEPHTLTVTFEDLIAAAKAAGVNLNKDSKVAVCYRAKVNRYAAAGGEGNLNDVKLEYANDPYEDGRGETTTEEVKVFTFSLNIVKTDFQTEPQPLDGVEFKLERNEDGKWGVFEQQDGFWNLTGWGNEEEDGTALPTADGGKFSLRGLKEGTYTLVETKALPDYEIMKDIVFEITASVEDETGSLGNAGLTPDTEKRSDVSFSGDMTKTGTDGGTLTLKNFPSPILPHTGSVSRIVLTGIGVTAAAAGFAAVLFALKKKKKDR